MIDCVCGGMRGCRDTDSNRLSKAARREVPSAGKNMSETGPVFTAVQEDATAFCMDWPVQTAGSVDSSFNGTVFVLDRQGARVCDTRLPAACNRTADEALNRIGWTRCGAWHRDTFGRLAARVIAVGLTSGAESPASAGVSTSQVWIGSLAEEAALHLA